MKYKYSKKRFELFGEFQNNLEEDVSRILEELSRVSDEYNYSERTTIHYIYVDGDYVYAYWEETFRNELDGCGTFEIPMSYFIDEYFLAREIIKKEEAKQKREKEKILEKERKKKEQEGREKAEYERLKKKYEM